MSVLPRASTFALAPENARRLQALVDAEASRVRDALRSRSFDGPVCALALATTSEHEIPTISYLAVWTDDARRAAVELADPPEELWQPGSWDHWDIDLDEPSAATYAEAERLASALHEVGCEDAEGAFLGDVASCLSHADWTGVLATTADFACWALVLDEEAESAEVFAETAPAAALAAYQQRGWLEARDTPASREMRQANLAAPDPFADLRTRAAGAGAAPRFVHDAPAGLAYLALIPGAALADRQAYGTEDEDLELTLDYDGHGRLAGVGFCDIARRVPPELLDGTQSPSIRRGTRRRPGTMLVLADRADDQIRDSHDFTDEVTYDCWGTLDIDQAGHLVAIRWYERHAIPPALRTQ